MGNLLLTLTATMMLQSASPAISPVVNAANSETTNLMQTQADGVTVPNRKVYGFFQNYVTPEGYGIGSFNMNNTTNPELLYRFEDEDMLGFYAGAVADGVFYGATYKYQSASAPLSLDLMSIDLQTGEKRYIGPWSSDASMKLQDMSYDYSTNTMYGVGYSVGASYLFTVDLTTGATTQVGRLPMTFFAIAINHNGDLYAVETGGSIYQINKETCRIQGFVSSAFCMGFMNNQSMEFDHTTGKLYWAAVAQSIDGSNASHLYEIDVVSGNHNYIGAVNHSSMSYGSPIIGMYIPYVLAGEMAPAAVSNINFAPDAAGALKTVISFVTPTLAFGGEDLTDLISVSIVRNDEVIATIETTEKGKLIEYTDEAIPADGLYKYAFYATNSVGDGEKIFMSTYVGKDAPAAVSNIAVSAQPQANGAVITWDAPSESLNGGIFDAEAVVYKIVRFPDEEVLSENWTRTMFIDPGADRIASYYYEITALNEIGSSSANSPYIVMGPAMNLPYEEDFFDINKINNLWTAVDGNNDGHSWMINTDASRSTFFDENYIGVEYFINYFLVDQSIQNGADEWLISPPFNIDSDKNYVLKFEYRSLTDDVLTITYGTNNTVETQIELETMNIHNSGYNGTTNYETTDKSYHLKEIELPAGSGVSTVGFHLTTPFPEANYMFGSHLQIRSVTIEEKTGTGLDIAAKIENRVWADVNTLHISGDFDYAIVSDLRGVALLEITESTTTVNQLQAGIYFVSVVKDGVVRTSKVVLK